MTDLVTAAATVADALRSPGTRDAALDALEALPPPIADDVALAAAPALADVVAGAAEETGRAAFDRAALLLARLLAEASPDPASMFGAAFAGERAAAYHGARLVAEAAQRALSGGEALTRADALSYACSYACYGPVDVRGCTAPRAAAGYTTVEHFTMVSFLLPRTIPGGHSRFLRAVRLFMC
eukprot:COSAG06_NODE_119_length_23111_cov_51.658613_23_plen_183_part_00